MTHCMRVHTRFLHKLNFVECNPIQNDFCGTCTFVYIIQSLQLWNSPLCGLFGGGIGINSPFTAIKEMSIEQSVVTSDGATMAY